MSTANTHFILTAAGRVMPAAERWQTYQAQLSRSTGTASHPWTRRSVVSWGGRALPLPASARS